METALPFSTDRTKGANDLAGPTHHGTRTTEHALQNTHHGTRVLLDQHQVEIEQNRRFWSERPLLHQIYDGFYERIAELVDARVPGRIVEIGSGIGQLKSRFPDAICTDLFPNSWLDLVCSGYEMPFRSESVSHLVLFDVFHHLETPGAFLREARRVLAPGGRLILFEPFISRLSFVVYGLLHHEPVAWRKPISGSEQPPAQHAYYAAQGNATRIFFHHQSAALYAGWSVICAKAFASFSYLLSGGFSKPCIYPEPWLPWLRCLDERLSNWPKWFGARCLVALGRV
jgi:SAM-dependent methyltransferase